MLAKSLIVLFPLFAFAIFKRRPKAQAAAIVVLVGSLLLPERTAIDFPMIPPIDKEYITYLSALIAGFVYRRKAMSRARIGTGLELILVALFFANVATAAMNPDPLLDEGRLEDGLGAYWIAAQTLDDLLLISLPYFVGRALFTSVADLYVLLSMLVASAVGYTGLILVEFLLSIPFRSWQFSSSLFGLPARVNIRWGMTQPVVFFDNGLALATFMAVALIGAAVLVKANVPLQSAVTRLNAKVARHLVTAGLLMTLNVAGIVYGLTFLMAHIFLSARRIAFLGLMLTTLAIVYPTLRLVDAFPYQAIVDFAAGYDAERARSLGGRFDEEEHVLGQIGDRLWVGWGNIARTPGAETFGEGEVGLDGFWTIRVGASGILGVGLYYLVMAVPALRAWRALSRVSGPGALMIGGVLCMVSIRMIDLIINGWWNCLPVFLAGVLTGVVRSLPREDRSSARQRGVA
jgi:hypothetical protein